jgi:hypothetical protein
MGIVEEELTFRGLAHAFYICPVYGSRAWREAVYWTILASLGWRGPPKTTLTSLLKR